MTMSQVNELIPLEYAHKPDNNQTKKKTLKGTKLKNNLKKNASMCKNKCVSQNTYL